MTRAPFIWTERQEIRPQAFAGAMRGAAERDDGKNRWFLFRHELLLEAVPETAPVKITCDGRYRFLVNGEPVARGPARTSPLHQRYDSIDIAPFLVRGPNVIGVIVHCYGADTAWYEQVRGQWRGVFGEGGLWLDGFVRTGPHWRCLETEAWARDTVRSNHALDFVEALDARRLPRGWERPGFGDHAWDRVQVLKALGGGPEAVFGGMKVEPFPVLVPSALQQMRETWRAPAAHLWTRRVMARPDLPVHRALYEEVFAGEPVFVPQISDPLPPALPMTLKTAPGEGVSVLLDMGRIFAGYPGFAVEAKGGETIDIAVAERLPGEFADGIAGDARIVPVPLLGKDAHAARFVCDDGVQRFEAFAWKAVRWMQVTVRDAPQGVTFLQLGARETHFPVENRGAFACSDEMLTRLWAVARETVKVCMQDGWIDCPSREQRQWLGDATVENLAAHAAFGPCIAPLNAEFLRKAAESQRPDGLTQMFAPGDHGTNGILIPDWTLQWIVNARDHAMLTGDFAVTAEILPAILRALAWFERHAGASGLIADLPYWHFMDWAGVGREGEACALNALYAGACEAAAFLCDADEAHGPARRLRAVAGRVRAALNARHWDEARGLYTDCVDPRTGAQGRRVSQHGLAAMLLWGDVPELRRGRVAEALGDKRRHVFTAAPPVVPKGETLDEETGIVLANTFFSHFVCDALAREGAPGDALALMRERFGPMLAAGATTLWESFGPTASLCHGFSATACYQLHAHVLGVRPAAPGYARAIFAPDLCTLDWAEGVVPTARGDLRVHLSRTAEGFSARIAAPMPVDIVAPPGFALAGCVEDNGVMHIAFAAA